MSARVFSDLRIIFSLLMGLGAVSLCFFFLVGHQDHWLGWPALISGVILIFLSPCVLAGAYFVLSVLEWKQGFSSRGRLSSPLMRASIGFGAAVLIVLLQIGIAYIEIRSFDKAAPTVDARLLNLARNKTNVDLSSENIKMAHELYADAQFLRYGRVHVVTSSEGRKVVFLPDLQILDLREEFQARRIRSTLIISTLLIGAGLCIVILVLFSIAASRWAVLLVQVE